jgi:phosphatidylserine decarboxylase
MDTIRSVLVPLHREGWRFVAIFLVVTLVLFWLWEPLGWIGLVLTAWCAYFFRDPPRTVPAREGLVVSPGDGVVQLIERAPPPPELDMGADPRLRISIFLNVFNVHVNRIPLGGTVGKLVYRPGKFFDASLDKASEENERQSIRIDLDGGRSVALVQIAGLVARRIVCDLHEGQVVRTGERMGLIRFGSRCDVYLEDGMVPLVDVGMTAIGGETVIADTAATELPRRGEVR